MKKIYFFICFLFVFVSCSLNFEPEIKDYINLTEYNSERPLGNLGGDVIVATFSTNNPWKAKSDSDWCCLVDTVGYADNFIKISANCDVNTSTSPRVAAIKIIAGNEFKEVYLKQNGVAENSVLIVDDTVYVNMKESGTLYKLFKEKLTNAKVNTEYGSEVWSFAHTLYINGNIDARDFSTMKWNFRNLETVDISNTKINAYSGAYGTDEGYGMDYAKNAIPCGWFFYWCSNVLREFPEELFDEGNSSIKKVVLPEGIVNIRFNAFARAYNLIEVNIPEGVETIEDCAFRHCKSIEKLYLPSTIKSIGWLCFTAMTSLKEVHIKTRNAPTEEDSFGYYPDAYNASRGWVINDDPNYVPKTDAILYVPKGCANNYNSWERYFQKIIEE